MTKHRAFILCFLASLLALADTPLATEPPSVLCLASDLHFYGSKQQEAANRRLTQALRQIGSQAWPEFLDGHPSGLLFAGKPIGTPQGIVLLGDLTSNGSWNDLNGLPWQDGFRDLYETGQKQALNIPIWLGLGNHDFGNDGTSLRMLEYVKSRHGGAKAPAKPLEFDAASGCYAFEVGEVLVVQLHRHAADTANATHASALPWLKQLLEKRAANGRPVILCQHYGFDPFGQDPRWWTEEQRTQFLEAIRGYNVIAIFHGHSHATAHYRINGIDIYGVNNVAPEINDGNRDGPGSFTLVRLDQDSMTVLPCQLLDDGSIHFSRRDFDSKPKKRANSSSDLR